MDFLKVNNRDQILQIRLNRPDVRNAFHPELIEQLTQIFRDIDDSTRLVELSGEGASFCAGADLGWMKSIVNYSHAENKADSEKLYDMFAVMWNCKVPLVTKAHGHVFGGALGLLAVSDVVTAETSTLFSFSEVKIGLIPAVISDFVIRKARISDCYRFMLSGKRFSADAAEKMGLCQFVGSIEECDEFADGFKGDILNSGPEAVRRTKALLRELTEVKDHKDLTAEAIAQARVSDEGQEGLSAFFDKRKAAWCE